MHYFKRDRLFHEKRFVFLDKPTPAEGGDVRKNKKTKFDLKSRTELAKKEFQAERQKMIDDAKVKCTKQGQQVAEGLFEDLASRADEFINLVEEVSNLDVNSTDFAVKVSELTDRLALLSSIEYIEAVKQRSRMAYEPGQHKREMSEAKRRALKIIIADRQKRVGDDYDKDSVAVGSANTKGFNMVKVANEQDQFSHSDYQLALKLLVSAPNGRVEFNADAKRIFNRHKGLIEEYANSPKPNDVIKKNPAAFRKYILNLGLAVLRAQNGFNEAFSTFGVGFDINRHKLDIRTSDSRDFPGLRFSKLDVSQCVENAHGVSAPQSIFPNAVNPKPEPEEPKPEPEQPKPELEQSKPEPEQPKPEQPKPEQPKPEPEESRYDHPSTVAIEKGTKIEDINKMAERSDMREEFRKRVLDSDGKFTAKPGEALYKLQIQHLFRPEDNDGNNDLYVATDKGFIKARWNGETYVNKGRRVRILKGYSLLKEDPEKIIGELGLTMKEEKRLAGYEEFRRHADQAIWNRSIEGRLDDHIELINGPEVAGFLPSDKSKVLFIDIGPGIASKYTRPAVTSQEMAESFPEMQVVAMDLPTEMDVFMGLKKAKSRRGDYSISQAKREALLSKENMHVLSGDGLKSLASQLNNPAQNPNPGKERPKINADTTIVVRAANSIDIYCDWQLVKSALKSVAEDFKEQPVVYLFNKEILFKPAGSTEWEVIGKVSDRGFNHNSRGLSRKGQKPYELFRSPEIAAR